MSRDDETGELPRLDGLDAESPPAPGEPVGRVNLPAEPELDEFMEDVEVEGEPVETDVPGSSAFTADAPPADTMMQKFVFGLVAFVVMALALFVILQGVFEQKMLT